MKGLQLTTLLLVLAYFTIAEASRKVEVSCSAFLYGQNDWEVKQDTSRCIEEVHRIRNNCGGTKINFVITQFWIDELNVGKINSFGTKLGNNVVPVSPNNLRVLTTGMNACFKAAVNLGFTTIEVTPHIDDGMGRGGWRNALVMNPLRKYDGDFSYYDIIIRPVVNAINAVISGVPPGKRVHIYMSMQGEMNFMLWKFPTEWHRMMNIIRRSLPTGAKVGISVNFNKLCGLSFCTPDIVSTLNISSIKLLLASIDFLGMSSYPSVSPQPKPTDFQRDVVTLANEFKKLGINLQNLLRAPHKELHFSEFGIGGATCTHQPATSASEAVKCPYYGIFGDYKASTDPWRNVTMRRFISDYYKAAVKWAAMGTGPTFNVSHIYMWNVASWDVTGIYHTDTNAQGSYKVGDVVTTLKKWNDLNTSP
jgi:hypothetical protein